jgi:hypothetical protein
VTCNSFYDFISGARVQMPTVSGAAADKEDGRHGVRAILTPSEEAQALIRDQVRMLSEMSRATPTA